MTRRLRGVRATAVVACAIGLALSILGARLVRDNLPDRLPFDQWTSTQTATWSVAIASGIILSISGAWLVWRLPSNPTGWWVLAAAVAFSGWIAGTYWPNAASPWAERLLPTVFIAAIVIAVLPWPTGRLEQRWARPFRRAMSAFVVIGIGSQFLQYHIPLWTQSWQLPTVGTLLDGILVATSTAVVRQGIAPALFLAAVVRRHRMMPVSVQASLRPALWGAVLLAASELWIFAFDLVLAPLRLNATPWRQLGTIRDVVAVGRFGAVGILLVVAEAIRRRSAMAAVTERRIDLGPLESHTDTIHEVASLLNDPTARLLVRGTDDLAVRDPRRRYIEIVDGHGALAAVVEHEPSFTVSATTRDALLVTVELAVLRRIRLSEAQARAIELRAVQRDVLDAQDRARRRLERDLHDGAQQRLVALSLEASMLARREKSQGRDDTSREALLRSIDSSIELAREIMRTSIPAAVDPGLAAGLAALDSTVALASTLEVDGDLAADHPATAALWFVASEAVANTLKHSRATTLRIRLQVDDGVAELTVIDDGIGGALDPPVAIVRRLAELPSSVQLDSPPGGGTALQVRIDLLGAREDAGVPA